MDEKTERLLREGFYWEGLQLSPGSSFSQVDKAIFELEMEVSENQEASGDRKVKKLLLLADVKRDIGGNKYGPPREMYFEILTRISGSDTSHLSPGKKNDIKSLHVFLITLSQNLRHPVTNEVLITCEAIWQNSFRPHFSNMARIRSKLAETLTSLAIQLVKDSMEENVGFELAVAAQDKAKSLLEVARDYSDESVHIVELLEKANQAKASLLRNHGV